jgi:hypothetical protein
VVERSARLSWIGGERRLVVRAPVELADRSPDMSAFVPPALLIAMRRAEPLQVDGTVSARLLNALPEAQEALSAWCPTYTRVREAGAATARGGRVACCFSRGVDSTYSAAAPRRPGDALSQLVYCQGFDPVFSERTARARAAAARAAASRAGLPLAVVETNLAEVIHHLVDFEDAFGAGLAMVGLSLAGAVERLVIPSSRDYGGMIPVGSHPLLDHLWSTERVRVEHDSVMLDRPAKVKWLVEHRLDLVAHLHVCWARDSATNCGDCLKCVQTMALLQIAGGLERAGAFPPRLDLRRVRELRLPALVTRIGWNDTYRAAGEGSKHEQLRRAIADLLHASAGLPDDGRPHGLSVHQTRLYRALERGEPLPLQAAGPRSPAATVGELHPGWPPPRDLPPGRVGLLAGVDSARRRHVYAVDEIPAGRLIGELGALLVSPPEDGRALTLDPSGRPVVGAARAPRPRERIAWVLGPLSYAAPLGARVRSLARRLLDGARGPRRATTDSAVAAGWLYSRPGSGRLALWAAPHPVLADVLLTTDESEAARIGYRRPLLLGYLEALAPLTGTLGVSRPALPWANWSQAALTSPRAEPSANSRS